jgi:hypothetical protein
MMIGDPLCQAKIEAICQPPMSASASPFEWNHLLSRPNGSS